MRRCSHLDGNGQTKPPSVKKLIMREVDTSLYALVIVHLNWPFNTRAIVRVSQINLPVYTIHTSQSEAAPSQTFTFLCELNENQIKSPLLVLYKHMLTRDHRANVH